MLSNYNATMLYAMNVMNLTNLITNFKKMWKENNEDY